MRFHIFLAPLCNGFATFMCILAYLESLVSRWWESERFYSPVDNKVELVMETFFLSNYLKNWINVAGTSLEKINKNENKKGTIIKIFFIVWIVLGDTNLCQ